METIVGFSQVTKLILVCPNCHTGVGVGVPAFFIAVYRNSPITCVHCLKSFDVKVDLLTRDAEQRNAAAEAGGDWVCIKCKTRNSDDKSICGFCDTPRLGG